MSGRDALLDRVVPVALIAAGGFPWGTLAANAAVPRLGGLVAVRVEAGDGPGRGVVEAEAPDERDPERRHAREK